MLTENRSKIPRFGLKRSKDLIKLCKKDEQRTKLKAHGMRKLGCGAEDTQFFDLLVPELFKASSRLIKTQTNAQILDHLAKIIF
ncbi:hypothetical protein BN14_07905 [Rhizoctonia solani AG-1 IB]|uniref:Uncharacterized protein n=1 Tax=Thanatephorus cucumeris (strain AG1-IB / isolate 7/3/14) TaxID=1108050 RepID=M5C392_THACB|nr:hypothetical protein BN14_07905 [Rhizoctonia solani AG-1 IB]